MAVHFDIFVDDAGEGRFTLVGGNGEPMAQSEGYSGPDEDAALANAENGAKDLIRAVVKEFAPRAVGGEPAIVMKPSQFQRR